MFTKLSGSTVIVWMAVISLIIFVLISISYSRKILNQSFTNKAKKDIVSIGVCFTIWVLILVGVYGFAYYDHFSDLIRDNKDFHDRLNDAHSDSDKLDVYDWYERKLQKKSDSGEITSYEYDIMYNKNWGSAKFKLNYAFPFKKDNRIMFFSIYYIFISGCLFTIYMKPTMSASEKNHPQKGAVMWLNILFGWTIIGWIVLLIWMNPSSAPAAAKLVPSDNLTELKSLLDSGIITQEDYDRKKQEILDKL